MPCPRWLATETGLHGPASTVCLFPAAQTANRVCCRFHSAEEWNRTQPHDAFPSQSHHEFTRTVGRASFYQRVFSRLIVDKMKPQLIANQIREPSQNDQGPHCLDQKDVCEGIFHRQRCQPAAPSSLCPHQLRLMESLLAR